MVDQKVWKGGGVSLALFCLYRLSRQSGYNMCYFSPFPHWLRDLLSAIYPFQMFPPFAMNALNARIWTTKPLAPGTSHRKRLKSVYSFSLLRNLTLPLYRFALRLKQTDTSQNIPKWDSLLLHRYKCSMWPAVLTFPFSFPRDHFSSAIVVPLSRLRDPVQIAWLRMAVERGRPTGRCTWNST